MLGLVGSVLHAVFLMFGGDVGLDVDVIGHGVRVLFGWGFGVVKVSLFLIIVDFAVLW